MRHLLSGGIALVVIMSIFGCGGSRSSELEFIEVSESIPHSLQFRENVTFFDLDGDGLKDMITPAPRPYYTSPMVFLNKGSYWRDITGECSFPPEVNFYGWVEADNQGNLYFAVHSRGIFALKRTGLCSWVNASEGLPTLYEFSSRALIIGDINGDSFIDIAALSDNFYASPSTIRVFTGDGNFEWTEASNGLPVRISGDHISLSDINSDGHFDIIVDNTNSSRNSVIWLSDSRGNWFDGSVNLPAGTYLATTQIKGGFLTMLFSETIEGGPFLFIMNNGIWTLVENTGLPDSWYISAIGVADINGDGIEDVVLGDNSTMTLRIFLGEGDYKYKESKSLPLPPNQGYIWNTRIQDINNDGRPDIAVNMASADNLGTIRVFIQR